MFSKNQKYPESPGPLPGRTSWEFPVHLDGKTAVSKQQNFPLEFRALLSQGDMVLFVGILILQHNKKKAFRADNENAGVFGQDGNFNSKAVDGTQYTFVLFNGQCSKMVSADKAKFPD